MNDSGSSHPARVAVLVNDAPLQLTLQARLLEQEGFTVRTFTSAEAALAEMDRDKPPAIILTDLYMPIIDGWRFCRLLRSPEFAAFNQVPILVVSATFSGDEPDRIAADLGAEGFISSPVDPRLFVQQVQAILSGRQVRPQLRVLVVEDSRAMAEMLLKAFSEHGYHADLAGTVKAAEAAIRAESYDVAVLDYHLPDGEGDALLDSLRNLRPGCACLMMTTDPSPDLALDWMKRGAADYLRKPFRSEFLLELCGRARRERALLRAEDLLELRTRELRENEERFRLIAENTSDGLLVLSPRHDLLFASPSYARLHGLPDQVDLVKDGGSFLDGIHPDERTGLVRKIQDTVAQGGHELNYVCRARHASGRTFWREDHARLTYGPGREHLNTYVVCRDISERKIQEGKIEYINGLYDMLSHVGRALVQVKTGDELFRTICEIAVDKGKFPLAWIGRLDPETQLVTPAAIAGRAAAYLDGISIHAAADEINQGPTSRCILEKRPYVCHDFEQDPAMAPWRAQALAFGLRSSVAVPIHSKDQIIGALMVYAGGPEGFQDRVVGLLEEVASHIAFGLEHLANLESQNLLQSQLMQAQKMESLGVLAGGVAHDMNNVLGAILGFAELNVKAHPEGSRTHRAFDTISKAATRGGKLVKGLLAFARRNPVEEQEVDMNAILREEVVLLERTTFSKVRLEQELDPGLRPICGDPSALSHAIMNLCVNAVDAMPNDGTLTLRTKNVDEDWIEVQVADTGLGMPKEVLDKALDPFFTTKGVGKGTGLGLSTVYNTVKAHKGQLDIQSNPGLGTIVKMRFPTFEAHLATLEPAPEAGELASHASMAVLVVDDDEFIQSSLVAILEDMGHTAILASSGEEALDILEGGRDPGVVILDMNMPGLGGARTLPRIRALCPRLPIILSTGRADQTALDLVNAHPHVALLPKPFQVEELRRVLDSLDLDGAPSLNPS